jgi:hypothetical protein
MLGEEAIVLSAGAGAGYAEHMEAAPSTHVPSIHPSQKGTRSYGGRLLLPQQRPSSSKPRRQYRLQQLPRQLLLPLIPPTFPPPSPPHGAAIRITPKDHLDPLHSIPRRIHAHTPNRPHIPRPHTTTATRLPHHNATDPPVSNPTTPHTTASHLLHRRRGRHRLPAGHTSVHTMTTRVRARDPTTVTTSGPARAPRSQTTRIVTNLLLPGTRRCGATSSSAGRRRPYRRASIRCTTASVVFKISGGRSSNSNSNNSSNGRGGGGVAAARLGAGAGARVGAGAMRDVALAMTCAVGGVKTKKKRPSRRWNLELVQYLDSAALSSVPFCLREY